ncbi:MAG: DNA gyrase inhibitor YacG [Succinivibrio sp.]|jgi:endogenous inhibitor of DNA gyrase (YacG/DUF329 family)|nr:DNA gyrase inhibitor YacG [Succinivibrio sp.]
MSLKDLLPPGSLEELEARVHDNVSAPERSGGELIIACPVCGKKHPYRSSDPFRPFCSERCKLIDLGEWASDNRVIEGEALEDDEDAELADSADLSGRSVPSDD